MNWIAVSPKLLCPCCEKPDWCRIGEKWVHCMRVPSVRPGKTQGWYHPLNGHAVPMPSREPPPRPTIDASGMMKRWFAQTTRAQYDALAQSLGVAASALLALQCAYAAEHRAWAWPMKNGAGAIVGIRLRAMSGAKWSVTGGHEGVFLPLLKPADTAYLPEGPTSLAAILTLGKYGIGRPNCSGGIAQIAATLARLHVSRAILLADNDEDKLRPNGDRWNPGLDGAQRLANEIGVPCCIVILPCKDCRELLRLGGTSELLDSLTQSLVWHQPNKVGNNITQRTWK